MLTWAGWKTHQYIELTNNIHSQGWMRDQAGRAGVPGASADRGPRLGQSEGKGLMGSEAPGVLSCDTLTHEASFHKHIANPRHPSPTTGTVTASPFKIALLKFSKPLPLFTLYLAREKYVIAADNNAAKLSSE